MNLEDGGNYLDHGIALSELLARVIPMLPVLKSTYHKMTSCVFIDQEYHCPAEFPAGYYWYGGKRKGSGRVDQLLHSGPRNDGEVQGQKFLQN